MEISGKKPIQDIVKDKELHKYLETIYLCKTQIDLIELCKKCGVKHEIKPKQFFDRNYSDKSKYKYKYAIAKLKKIRSLTFEELLKNHNGKPIVVLDHIHDPFNLGAILRTCAATGVSGIILPKNNQSPINHGTVLKASQGYSLKVNVVVVSNLHQTILSLKRKNFWIYATDVNEKSKDFRSVKYSDKSVLILGNEGRGVSELLRKSSDFLIHIPMEPGVDSLNVSVASGILLFEMSNQMKD